MSRQNSSNWKTTKTIYLGKFAKRWYTFSKECSFGTTIGFLCWWLCCHWSCDWWFCWCLGWWNCWSSWSNERNITIILIIELPDIQLDDIFRLKWISYFESSVFIFYIIRRKSRTWRDSKTKRIHLNSL